MSISSTTLSPIQVRRTSSKSSSFSKSDRQQYVDRVLSRTSTWSSSSDSKVAPKIIQPGLHSRSSSRSSFRKIEYAVEKPDMSKSTIEDFELHTVKNWVGIVFQTVIA